ncbi:hypothetical protein [Aneurinibacillus tyrosinisolvens]|uniref:hypothetical protein n=1 Tax=Aneurinibacillus tyrosinisolvens TaxID=1443435 RepID=UPI00063F82A9|nr:hypothetical protein [Aneurinibacillus tyrosinisolvens]
MKESFNEEKAWAENLSRQKAVLDDQSREVDAAEGAVEEKMIELVAGALKKERSDDEIKDFFNLNNEELEKMKRAIR